MRRMKSLPSKEGDTDRRWKDFVRSALRRTPESPVTAPRPGPRKDKSFVGWCVRGPMEIAGRSL